MTLKACITTLVCFVAAAVQAQQALPDSTAPVTLEPMKIEAETLKRLPVRGVEAMVGLMPGVVTLDGSLHMRGGRADEIGYTVNGMNVNRPMDGSFSLPLIHNAIESISVYSGGYSAGQSGRLSGLVEITTKTGGDRLKLTGEIISDDFWKVKGDDGALRVLGLDDTYSYGYNDYILTLGGPVPGVKGLRFFTAGEIWNEASEATRFEGFEQDSLNLSQTWYRWDEWDGQSVTETLDYYADIPPGRLPGGGRNGWLINSNLSYKRSRLAVRMDFNYSHERRLSSTTEPDLLTTISDRPYREIWNVWNVNARLQYQLNEKAELSLGGGYFSLFYEGADSKWGDDFIKWGDPELNPALLSASLTRGFTLPYDYFWVIPYPDTPAETYSKTRETRWQIEGQLAFQLHQSNRLLLGFETQQETVRRYSINARRLYGRMLDVARDPARYTEYDIYRYLDLCAIGYDWLGNEVDHDQSVATLYGLTSPVEINIRNKPVRPSRMGIYLHDEMTLGTLFLKAGLQYKRIKNGWWTLKDWTWVTEVLGGGIADSDIEDEKTYTYLLPRLAVSMAAGRHAVLHARYGCYVQPPNSWETWGKLGYTVMVEQLFRSSYFEVLPNPSLKPMENRLAEIGVHLSLSDQSSLDIAAFHKESNNLLGKNEVIPQAGATYSPPSLYINGEFSSSMGLTAQYDTWRQHVRFHVDYTWARALSSYSNVSTYRVIGWEPDPYFPAKPIPEDFDVRHQLNVWMSGLVPQGRGLKIGGWHPLENVFCSLTATVRSGMPYTPIGWTSYSASRGYYEYVPSEVYGYSRPRPSRPLNSYHKPWFWQVDMTLSKAFRLGPINLEAYVWAINLFDTKSVIDVFRQTGSNTTDGWVYSEEGREQLDAKGEEWVKWYNADLTGCGTFGWQPPRQLRAGLRFEL